MASGNPNAIPYNLQPNRFGDIIPPVTFPGNFVNILDDCIENILNGIPISKRLNDPIVRGFNNCPTGNEKRRFLFWLFLEAAIRERLDLVKFFIEKPEMRKIIDEYMHIPLKKIVYHQSYLWSTPVRWDSILLFVLDEMKNHHSPMNQNILYLVMSLYEDQLPIDVLSKYGKEEFFKKPFENWQSDREYLFWVKEPSDS